MKSFLKFSMIFLSILLLSAVLAPILFRFLPFKFERIFNRLVMVFSITTIFFFVRRNHAVLQSYGFLWNRDRASLFFPAFIAGVVTLTVLAGFRIAAGNALWVPENFELQKWILRVVKALGSALAIGVIEEFFFRGFVFYTVKDHFSWGMRASLLITSLLYSSLHFLGDKSPLIGPHPVFWDSLKLMAAPFKSIADWHVIWPAVVGLFLFGMVLNVVSFRARSLYPAIGLHAGCVFFIKMDGLFVDFLDHDPLLWGSHKIYDGMLGWIFILALGWISMKLFLGTHGSKKIAPQI